MDNKRKASDANAEDRAAKRRKPTDKVSHLCLFLPSCLVLRGGAHNPDYPSA